MQAAADALVAILAKLHIYRGASRFTTWAYKFALLEAGVREALTPHQRAVFTALALNGVPIDVLSERMDTTRGALYKTLHDARAKLRAGLVAAGHLEEVNP